MTGEFCYNWEISYLAFVERGHHSSLDLRMQGKFSFKLLVLVRVAKFILYL